MINADDLLSLPGVDREAVLAYQLPQISLCAIPDIFDENLFPIVRRTKDLRPVGRDVAVTIR